MIRNRREVLHCGTFRKLGNFFATRVYYAFEMTTRPQTLHGIAGSPASMAADLGGLCDGDAKPAAVRERTRALNSTMQPAPAKFPTKNLTQSTKRQACREILR